MLRLTAVLALALVGGTNVDSCAGSSQPPQSASGVKETQVTIPVQSNGLTVEQQNVRDRLVMDNKPGSVKHLYVISAISGDVLLYSTVRGKVTSSSKRLSPTSIVVGANGDYRRPGFEVLNGYVTSEVLQDDGTYGSSIEYLYWWDTRGVYHQHYVSGGQIVHVSDQPLRVARVIINLSPAN